MHAMHECIYIGIARAHDTMHKLYALYPAPYTLHTPYTHPIPYTLRPTPYTLHHTRTVRERTEGKTREVMIA